MGFGRWDPGAWAGYASTTSGKATHKIFTAHGIDPALDPLKNKMRESCDSAINPESTPIIVALDVTGSMGELAGELARNGLNTLIQEIYDRKPVPDPHVMLMAVGDAYCDDAPLQVTQFEADIRLAEQLKLFYLEGGGGGNSGESYNLPWYYAAYHTKIDSMAKRGRKGLLFTVGDEPMLPKLLADHVKEFLDGDLKQDISTRDLLTAVQQKYDVYHVIIKEGSFASAYLPEVEESWHGLLGRERVIGLSDYRKLSEAIVSAIQINQGAHAYDVARSWDGSTAVVLADALKDMVPAPKGAAPGGVFRFARPAP